ncbi:MAG: endonuclease/exonuclease/phosphatase family protein [Hymenobacteraceae bacterium]|nr:endonuclease/exonuclease/phosphatase family protein [Hymenobacteraceae bacterium]
MKLALEIFGTLLVLLALLPWLRTYRWWVRIWDFPRVQIAIGLVLVATVYVWLYGWGDGWQTAFILALFGALTSQLFHIRRFTPFWPKQALGTKEASPRHSFSLLVSNVRMENTRYARFLKLVRENDPDLLLINEPDANWGRHLRHELNPRYPHRIECPLENTYGMMLYSKFRLLHPRVRYLVEQDIPSFRVTVAMPAGHTFELFTVHPQPPQFLRNTDTRESELLQVAREVIATSRPSIVVGDLNDVAWSRTTNLFRKLSGLLDPRIGRGFYNTYNAFVPFFRYSLDHIFYSPTFRLIRLKKLGFFGSDHFPIIIRLTYEPTGASEHEVPEPEHEEVVESHEMIRDGLETARTQGTAPVPTTSPAPTEATPNQAPPADSDSQPGTV